MSHIEIRRTHNLGETEARARVERIERDLLAKYKVDLTWRGEDATIKGPGVTGDAHVDGESLRISLKLGLMLRPMASKLQQAIERKVDEALQG